MTFLQESVRAHSALSTPTPASAADAVLVWNSQGRVLACGGGAEQMFGYEVGALKGMPVASLVIGRTGEDGSQRQNGTLIYSDGEQNRQWRARCRRADGKTFMAELKIEAVEGQLYLGHIRNESDGQEDRLQWKLHDALQQTTELARLLMSAPTDIVLLLDAAGNIVSHNKMASAVLAQRVGELARACLYDLLPPDTASFFRQHVDQVYATLSPVHFELLLADEWFDALLSPMDATHGAPTWVALLARSITEKRLAERSLRDYAHHLQIINTAGFALTKELELDAVLETLLNLLQDMIPYDGALVLLCEGEGEIRIRATRGEMLSTAFGNINNSAQPAAQIESPVAEKLFADMSGFLIDDLEADESWRDVLQSCCMCSWLGMPLVSGGRCIGFFGIGKKEAHYFDDQHMRLARAIAPQAATAIENALFYEEARERSRELEAIAELSKALRAADNIKQLVPILLDQIVGYGDVVQGSIAIFEPETGDLLIIGSRPPLPADAGQLRLKGGEGVSGRVMNSGGIYETFDVHHDPLVRIPFIVKQLMKDVQGGIWLPLRTQDALIGIMQIGFRQSRMSLPAEQSLYQALAEVAAIALTRLQFRSTLEQAVEQRTSEIRQRQQMAEGLRYILTILNSDRPLEEVLEYIISQACWSFDTTSGAIYSWQEKEAYPVLEVSHGLPPDFADQQPAYVVRNAMSQSLSSQQPVAIGDLPSALAADVSSSSATTEKQKSLIRHYHALLSIPIIIAEQGYGCIVLYFAEQRDFTADGLYLGVASSDQAALAIENARLRKQVETSAIASERTRLAHELHDAVTQSLFSASLLADVLPKIWRRNPDEGLRRLDEIRQLTKGALAEMRMLLIELRPRGLIEISLDLLLRQLTEAATNRAQTPIECQVTDPGKLPEEVQIGLYRIAQEALNNIVKHAQATRARVSLQLDSTPEGRQVKLRINDNGVGFNRTNMSPQHLGLRIMEERAEGIGAQLHIESFQGQGATITALWSDAPQQPITGFSHE